MGKPFSYAELRASIEGVLRRTQTRQPRQIIAAGDLRTNLHDRSVTVAGYLVSLSNTEYRLLCTLGSEPTRVFTKAELLKAVWGHSTSSRTRTLDTHAHRLRQKLASAGHPLVITVWGAGLQLIPATPGSEAA